MIKLLAYWSAFRSDRRAITALEYAIIAGVLVATIVIGFNVFAGDVSVKFNSVGTSL